MLKKLHENRYLTLLISTFLLLYGQILAPESWGVYPKTFLFLQHGGVGLLLFFEKKYLRNFFLFFFILLTLSFVVDLLDPKMYYRYFGFVYVLYFCVLSANVFKKILTEKKVNKEMLAAVMCGFVLLILLTSIIFITIENMHHESFSNLGEAGEKLNNLRYFSFICLLTVGFGDIVPLTTLAKNTTGFLCLIGHFYTVIVMGIFIGKYINNLSDADSGESSKSSEQSKIGE